MPDPLLIAKDTRGEHELTLLPALANRHGLITGATGTGKTVTLQRMAESLSRIGVPVFMADVKGDLAGLSQAGELKGKIKERVEQLKLDDFKNEACPVVFWDMYGKQGHPVRTTVSEMGPLLLARMLNLNDTQQGVTFFTRKTDNTIQPVGVEIQPLAPGDRVRAHQRVLDIGRLGDFLRGARRGPARSGNDDGAPDGPRGARIKTRSRRGAAA